MTRDTTETPATPLLDRVAGPSDLRQMPDDKLAALADELRAEVISAVSQTGGHLGSSLGVVELSVAIHAVFNTPMDKLVWDVGHQCYPHKILTGRRDRIRTLRQKDGLSGFTKRSESAARPVRGGAQLHLDQRRARLHGRARHGAGHGRRDRRHRRRRDQRGHGLRGAQQCGRRGAAALRDPQ